MDMRIQNVLFDMDGVLLDSEQAIRTACIEALKEYGISAQHEDFFPFTGMGEDRFIGGVAEKYGVPYCLEMKERAYSIYGEIAGEQVILFDGIRDMVMELKQRGYGLAVASSADQIKVSINLKCMGLSAEDFQAVVTGSDIRNKKPDPEIFLTAASRIPADPARCVVVEDAPSGIRAGKAAGAVCIGVTSTFDEGLLREAGADFVVRHTPEILDLLGTTVK